METKDLSSSLLPKIPIAMFGQTLTLEYVRGHFNLSRIPTYIICLCYMRQTRKRIA